MVWFVSVAIAIVLCGVAFLFGRAMRSEAEPGSPESDRGLIVIVLSIIVFVVWAGAHTALSSLKQIEAGNVAVVYQFGEIIGQKSEGLQFVGPWQEIRTESIRVQRHQFSNVSGFSSETQDVVITATVNYRVDPGAVQNLYRTVGVNWFDILVEPRINQYFKAETVKYSTVDIAPNRETIRKNVRDALALDLQNFSVTVEDLLTMRSGLETTSNRNYGRWVQSRNWVRHVLTRPMVDRPGGRMIYSTGSTHLLSAIIARATGTSTLEYGRLPLARPLGLTLPAWLRDPQGIYFGGNEMTLTPRAMLAVGDLYRRGGSIDGFEVVSREWVRESFTPRTASRYSRRQYGYGWWMRMLAGHPTYYAWGYGGQFIFVIPELDAVIVATSSPNPGDGRRPHRRDLDMLLEQQLVPAIRRAATANE